MAGIVVLFILLELIAFFVVWHFMGREPEVNILSIYEREPPYDYSPAVVEALINQNTKKPTAKSIPAELLDLCIKDRLKITRVPKEKFLGPIGGDDYKIQVLSASDAGLPESEKLLLQLISEAARRRYDGGSLKSG